MQGLRKEHPLARTKDYLKEEENAHKRVMLLKRTGMEHRVETHKEELRAYEYMIARGYAPEAVTKEDLQKVIRSFKEMTS